MTPKKPTQAKRGRKPKAEGEKLEQLTIRLPSKLKYGLEMLARAQHRSLSQAVEWALQVGLNGYTLRDDEGRTLGEALDLAWQKETEMRRLLAVYDLAPTLLPFEDFVACEIVETSTEYADIFDTSPAQTDFNENPEKFMAEFHEERAQQRDDEATFYRFCELFWPAIRAVAVERANAGRGTRNVSILGVLGFRKHLHDDAMKLMREMANGLAGQQPKTIDDLSRMLSALAETVEDQREIAKAKYFSSAPESGSGG